MGDKRDRKQINVRLERELYDFLVKYARGNYKTVTGVLREMVADLKKAHEERVVVDENGNTVPVKKQ
jgi:hypothetical protein